MEKFMLMLRGNRKEFEKFNKEELNSIFQEYMDWTQELIDKGVYHSGAALQDNENARLMKNNGKTIEHTDGAYVDTKEALGGYWIISAESLNHATEFAKGCPGFKYGESLEILPLMPGN